MGNISMISELDHNTRVFRYISLSKFMNIIEFESIAFSRIMKCWEDSWELPVSKIKTVDDSASIINSLGSDSDELFGQCWTKLDDSDAMWRVYSPDKQGIMISTRIKNLLNIDKITSGFIGKVHYYNELLDGMKYVDENYKAPSIVRDAFLKRSSFKHEEEIRITFLNRHLSKEDQVDSGINVIKLNIEINEFIDDIKIDPRAPSYYVDTIKEYCISKGIQCQVTKSDLYDGDISDKLGLYRRWTSTEEIRNS